MGNNTYSDVLSEGNCRLSINGIIVILSNVLYVPDVRRNLISVSIPDKKGYEIRLKSSRVTICKGKSIHISSCIIVYKCVKYTF